MHFIAILSSAATGADILYLAANEAGMISLAATGAGIISLASTGTGNSNSPDNAIVASFFAVAISLSS